MNKRMFTMVRWVANRVFFSSLFIHTNKKPWKLTGLATPLRLGDLPIWGMNFGHLFFITWWVEKRVPWDFDTFFICFGSVDSVVFFAKIDFSTPKNHPKKSLPGSQWQDAVYLGSELLRMQGFQKDIFTYGGLASSYQRGRCPPCSCKVGQLAGKTWSYTYPL